MSWQLADEDGILDDLASSQGMRDLRHWVETLSIGEFTELVQLFEHGYNYYPDRVAEQADRALVEHGPSHTVAECVDVLSRAARRAVGVIIVTNGLVAPDRPDDSD